MPMSRAPRQLPASAPARVLIFAFALAWALPHAPALSPASDAASPAKTAFLPLSDPSQACEQARRLNRWCAAANAGYVAGVEIRSRFLYEALDAHGHDIDPAAVKCDTCRKALKSDGFCAAHRMGYVHGLAYMSPLTYDIARGRTIDPATITCKVCRQHTEGIGWCDTDRLGIAGRVAFDDRQVFREFSKNYQILLAAVEASKKCETCAAAMMADGYCGIHRVKYLDGKAVSGTPP